MKERFFFADTKLCQWYWPQLYVEGLMRRRGGRRGEGMGGGRALWWFADPSGPLGSFSSLAPFLFPFIHVFDSRQFVPWMGLLVVPRCHVLMEGEGEGVVLLCRHDFCF